MVKSTPKNENRRNLDEKEFAKLRQLIHSSKQEDRDKANLMIQNFYRDDERRTQMKNRRFAELEKVAENTKLLDEMLSQYRPGETSDDELAIMREIFESCEGMHPTVIRLAEETQQSEGMLGKLIFFHAHFAPSCKIIIPNCVSLTSRPFAVFDMNF